MNDQNNFFRLSLCFLSAAYTHTHNNTSQTNTHNKPQYPNSYRLIIWAIFLLLFLLFPHYPNHPPSFPSLSTLIAAITNQSTSSPSSHMQTSTAPDVKHPLPLAKSTLSVAAQHRRPSLGYLFAPLNVKTPETSTPSTNRLILDYLLFISIQSRLRQADIGLYHDASQDEDEEVLKRWTEAGTRANKDHIAVESIIHGKRGIKFSTRQPRLEKKITRFFFFESLEFTLFGTQT
jgi:hypothetical protein